MLFNCMRSLGGSVEPEEMEEGRAERTEFWFYANTGHCVDYRLDQPIKHCLSFISKAIECV